MTCLPMICPCRARDQEMIKVITCCNCLYRYKRKTYSESRFPSTYMFQTFEERFSSQFFESSWWLQYSLEEMVVCSIKCNSNISTVFPLLASPPAVPFMAKVTETTSAWSVHTLQGPSPKQREASHLFPVQEYQKSSLLIYPVLGFRKFVSQILSGWWFQLLWKILVNWDDYL